MKAKLLLLFNKLKWYLAGILFLIGMLGVIQLQSNRIKSLKSDNNRIDHNYKVVQDSVKLIKGENNLYASRIESQSLTINEIKSYYQNLVSDISDMKIQLRKVTGITAFNTETTNNTNTFFKDSTRIDSIPIETLNYSDKWFDISIRKIGLKASISSISRDSLIQVVHWDRIGKFWPTRFLTKKEYFQDIKSMNPNSRITYSQWIIPIKKK